MIIGIGHDIIEVERVRKACEKQAFLAYSFSPQELECFNGKWQSLAGNFTVKEAVVKAYGTGFREGIKLNEIEVLRDEYGAPYVNLYGNAKRKAEELGVTRIHVTISNLKELASSFVILE